MISILKIELKKSFTSRIFFICLAISTAICLLSAVQNIQLYFRSLEGAAIRLEYGGADFNPMYPACTLYNSWIGVDYQNSMTPLFYMLLPLLAGLAYGWSYCNERKSGYTAQMVSRSSKRGQYFLAKYIATFLTGGAVTALPMALNVAVTACVVPAYPTHPYYSTYYAIDVMYQQAKALFYTRPFLYIVFIIFQVFVFTGLFATVCVALAFFVKNKFAVILLPFLGVFAVQYLQDNVLRIVTGDLIISPMDFLRGYSLHMVLGLPILIWLILLLAFTLGVTWIKGAKDDVL